MGRVVQTTRRNRLEFNMFLTLKVFDLYSSTQLKNGSLTRPPSDGTANYYTQAVLFLFVCPLHE